VAETIPVELGAMLGSDGGSDVHPQKNAGEAEIR